MLFHFADSGFFALLQVILIDLTLAGDNAIVIGLAASRVPKAERRKVIMWGLAAAVVLRVVLASLVVWLLHIAHFMVLAGGILLLWVSWRLFREIRQINAEEKAHGDAKDGQSATPLSAFDSRRLVRRATIQIALADISMSLDNVLAVAGAAWRHYFVLVLGLLLSIGLMGIAANMVAKLLHRFPWISYAGLFIVVYVAITMIVQGSMLIAAGSR